MLQETHIYNKVLKCMSVHISDRIYVILQDICMDCLFTILNDNEYQKCRYSIFIYVYLSFLLSFAIMDVVILVLLFFFI